VPVIRCFDTANGQDLATKGTTSLDYLDPVDFISIRSDPVDDTCVNANTVKEFYCSASTRTSVDRSCPSATTDPIGACAPATTSSFDPSCTASDHGENLQS
jgi:hypothetical protein